MADLRIINAATVRTLLTMDVCIDAMADAMAAVTAKTVVQPLRSFMHLHDGSGLLGLMPGAMSDRPAYGAKVVSLHPGNPAKNLPTIQGFVALFDHNTGAPVALMDGAEITGTRTAAASGLATRLLAREDAATQAVIGTGVQARTHVLAGLSARPGIRETLIWGRTPEKARALATEMAQETGTAVRAVDTIEEAAKCDVISMVTAAKEPVMMGDWLTPGAHINLVGPHKATEREADTRTITRSSVYVDLMDSAMKEAGELLIPMEEGAFSQDAIIGEIGGVVSATVRGRQSAEEITLYKSVGIVAQDLYAAWATLKLAEAQNLGSVVSL